MLNQDSFPHYFRILYFLFNERISTLLNYTSTYWWGVDIGEKCSFVGKTYFRRPPKAKIVIGNRCRFLSNFSSNQHGLKGNCMLSALDRNSEIILGNDVGMSGVVIAAVTRVTIGSRVLIGANTTITDTNSHPINYQERFPDFYNLDSQVLNNVKTTPVIIEDDVFIGMSCLILKGVRIGKGAVIGAGSIVVNDIPAYSIAGGQPAKILKSLQ